jgi:hypothetical protein
LCCFWFCCCLLIFIVVIALGILLVVFNLSKGLVIAIALGEVTLLGVLIFVVVIEGLVAIVALGVLVIAVALSILFVVIAPGVLMVIVAISILMVVVAPGVLIVLFALGVLVVVIALGVLALNIVGKGPKKRCWEWVHHHLRPSCASSPEYLPLLPLNIGSLLCLLSQCDFDKTEHIQ